MAVVRFVSVVVMSFCKLCCGCDKCVVSFVAIVIVVMNFCKLCCGCD